MKLFLVSSHIPTDWGQEMAEKVAETLRAGLLSSGLNKHEVVEDESEADAFLFPYLTPGLDPLQDGFHRALRTHPLVLKQPGCCFTWNDQDFPVALLPGMYASLHRRFFSSRLHRTYSYHVFPNPYITKVAESFKGELEFFVSFMGMRSAGVRRKIFDLDFGRKDVLVVETQCMFDGLYQGEKYQTEQERYAEVLARSRFVLCPRGNGTTSYRLFEVMQMGRVPVIIADGWVASEGPDWNSFSLRVSEAEVSRIPALLEQYESKADEMGRYARQAWEQWFAPEMQLHRVAEYIESIRPYVTHSCFMQKLRWYSVITKYCCWWYGNVLRRKVGKVAKRVLR